MPTEHLNGAASGYSVPIESELLLQQILTDPAIAKYLPPEASDVKSKIRFVGPDKPTLPVNWRIAESTAALHGLEACIIAVLLKKKYNVPAPQVKIDTEHSQLFPMSGFLWILDPKGENIESTVHEFKLRKYLAAGDFFRRATTPHRAATTNIYRCADGKFFQLHGSLNPDPVLDAINLPHDGPAKTSEEAWVPFKETISKINSENLLHAMTKRHQAGDIVNSVQGYLDSPQGRANADVGLFEMYHSPNSNHLPSWWPASSQTSAARPLAGLKVVDLTRIIAGPSITRGLAQLGASVMRVMSPNVPDFTGLHIDLNWGKWNSYVDLKTSGGRKILEDLIADADVVVNGYRPSVLDKFGFSQDDIINIVASRNRGIVSVRENCYGWHGPQSHRPGWQPVSDACVGISHGYGKALNLKDDEPATPLFPNSDYSTGLIGVSAILCALIQRAEIGGSYKIDLALNYYNLWLARTCGAYPPDIWEAMWAKYGHFQFKAENPMEYSAPRVMSLMSKHSDSFRDQFFEDRNSRVLGVDIRCVKAVIEYPNNEVQLGYNVGTRGNGTDDPRWPEDLMTEVVR